MCAVLLTLQEVLQEAKQLFERAVEESVPRSSQLAQDYSTLMLLGREMEEMRWFMVPYEAHLYLTGCHPPAIKVPFQPRDYEHDHWYSRQYLEDWDRHWNPHYWEEVRREREAEKKNGEDPGNQWQWTIYPATRSPTHMIHLQPIRLQPKGGHPTCEKKAFASMECLHNLREVERRESPVSPPSSGYSSEGEEREETAEAKKHRRKGKRKKARSSGKNGRVVISYGEDSRQGKKCVIM